ncbi:MAG: hypothetical protein LBH76_08785 [Propionibacteriaceae bacterium]|nr:hypothetical protein [Propionibacteriaceae bacterium]
MSTQPVAIRFDQTLLEQVRRRARVQGATVSAVVQTMVDEGLRMAAHPGIVFRDGPAGRRPGLARGLDVWEVVQAVRQVEERSALTPTALAEEVGVTARDLATALDYYAQHNAEIDAWIADEEQAAEAALAAWQAKQALLA